MQIGAKQELYQARAKQRGRSDLMGTSGINPFTAAAWGNPCEGKLCSAILPSSAEPRKNGEPNARTLSSRVYLGALQGDKHRPFLFLCTEYESIKAAKFQAFNITRGPAAFPPLCQDGGD